MKTIPDRIEKRTVLRAPQAKVWSALSDSQQFGYWFGAAFEGPFVAGQRVKGCIRPTKVDPEVAKMQESHDGKPFEIHVERVEPETCLAFRWHPYEEHPEGDFDARPTTLVTFTLAPAEGGTLLTIVESGFDQIPLDRRADAFTGNEGGWEHQAKNIAKYLDHHAR